MSDTSKIDISEPAPMRLRENHCYISISDTRVGIDFDHPLPELPHKPSRVEVMAAAALVGIARALTGKGEEDVIRAVAKFERRTRK